MKKKELITSGCKIIGDKKSKWLQSNIKWIPWFDKKEASFSWKPF